MSEQQFTDFFDPEIQKIVSEDGCSIYRMKNLTGEGVITRYEILPGIELFYNDFHMSDGQNQNKLPHADVLEINHCREGRFECEFANGDYQYVGAGDLAINRLTNETTSTYFPLSHYHGISITIDLPQADQTMKRIESVIGGLNIDVFSIVDKFCKNDTCVVLRTQSEIEHIFGTLSGGASDDCLLFESESAGIADVSESGFASGLPGRTKIFCKKSSTNNKESTGIYDSRSSQPLYFAGAIRKI